MAGPSAAVALLSSKASPAAGLRVVACSCASTPARAARGARPGRITHASQPSPERLSAGITPARISDDLPMPEGPTTATSGRLRSSATMRSMSRSRPKKRSASASWNATRPAKGLLSAAAVAARRPGASASSSVRSARALAVRCSTLLMRQRSITAPSGPISDVSSGMASRTLGMGTS